jgi:peptidoglycan/LPS O-acetylase OafA/YrhL
MITNTSSHSVDHLKYLDAARGIAAVMVLVYHFIGWRYHDKPEIKWAHLIANGSDAVSFFFVLSGFVLSYKPIVYGQTISVPRFYVTRIFRLMPGFIVTVCILALYWQRDNLSFATLVDEFIFNKNKLWEELFLLRNQTRVYIPGWTLQLELAISFLIPFLVLMARSGRKVLLWFLLCVFLEGHLLINYFHVHFILGVLLSCYYKELRAESFKQNVLYRYRYLLLLFGFILFSIRHIDQIKPIGPTYKYLAAYFQIDFFIYTGIGSFIIIAWLICSDRIQHILTNPFLLFLGKVSYGIYLSHWFVIDVIYKHWDWLMTFFPSILVGFIVMGLLSAVATITMATFLYHFVEHPFISLGKRISARMKPGLLIK